MVDDLLKSLSDIEVIALTLIGEARGEPIEGQVAVGSVIRNRLHSPSKYITYKDVCLAPNQFSCWNPTDKNYPYLIELANKMVMGQKLEDPYLRQCLLVAQGIYDWAIRDNTSGAKHYLSNALYSNVTDRPKWAKFPLRPITHGNQTFFSV